MSHCDSDWEGDVNTCPSTTGYIFSLSGGALTLRSCLQPTVALSSTEADYRAITESGQELLWLQNMMMWFGLKVQNPTILESENQGAIHLTSKSIFHGQTKHVESQYHLIREIVKQGSLRLKHCPTHDMIANLMTKPLGKAQFQRLCLKLGMSKVSASS